MKRGARRIEEEHAELVRRIDAALVTRALDTPHTHPWHDLLTADVQRAATVLPLYLDAGEPHVVAIVRGAGLRDHAGEIAFPGGKLEASDASLRDAGVRELEEELGVSRAECTYLGALSEIPTRTGKYLIAPFVVSLAPHAQPRAATNEVERVLRVPIVPWLTGELRRHEVTIPWRDSTIGVPHFVLPDVTSRVLFGSSAYTFYELLGKIAAALGRELPASIPSEKLPWL